MLIRVLACSLSPGDWRMLSGDTALVKHPASFPYVPGLDVSGIVEELGQDVDASAFSVGDAVVATWSGAFGQGGLAEYALVDPKSAAHRPASVDAVQAAALSNSAGHALNALRAARIRPGDRVLILGGSGGVGSAAVQLARSSFGASFVAATSSHVELLERLGIDRAIDYTREEWWNLPEFTYDPFDAIIDCAEGVGAWRRVRDGGGVLKGRARGGRFVAVVFNEWHIEFTRWWHIFPLIGPPLARMLWPRGGGAPRYTMYGGVDDVAGTLTELMRLADEGKLTAIIDPSSPLPLTAAGVCTAFDVLQSWHAQGKVVVQVSTGS